MAFSAKAGTVSLTTGDSGTKVVSGLGFTPKIVLFWVAGVGYSTNSTRQQLFGVGYTGGAEHCVTTGVRDGNLLARSTLSSTYALFFRASAGDGGGRYTFSSLDSDGFTLGVTSAVQTNITVSYLALGGADLSVAAGLHTVPAGTGGGVTTSVTGLAFQPNALIFVGSRIGTSTPADANGCMMSVGFATASDEEAQVAWSQQDNADPTNNSTIASTDKMCRRANTSDSWDKHLSFASFNSDGFTLNVDDTDSEAFGALYIALNVPNAWAGSTVLQTGTGTWNVNGAGFTPSALLAFCGPEATTTGTADNDLHVTGGFATGASERTGSTVFAADGLSTTSDAETWQYTDAILKGYQRDGADSFSLNSVVDFSQWNSGQGVRLDQTDAAPSAGIVAMLLLGDSAAPAASKSILRHLL